VLRVPSNTAAFVAGEIKSHGLLAGIFDGDAIHRLLAHLGLPTEPPEPLLPW
jgi:hypothetical protein